ncbi:MAG: hypothetical protein ACLUFV_11340 [Acutalibacteraceae bacterium]
MNYISTRTAQSEPRTASYVIREGIAPDGGLYVPDALPALDGETLQRLSEADYCGRASHILGLFLTDFTKEELAACASAAYAPSASVRRPPRFRCWAATRSSSFGTARPARSRIWRCKSCHGCFRFPSPSRAAGRTR